jgi:integrase
MNDPQTLEPLLINLTERLAELLPKPHALESLTFGELFASYYERHVKVRCKDSEAKNAHYFFKAHGPRWAAMPVHLIKRSDVQAWVDELGAKSRSAATRAANVMQSVINWGIRRELLPPIANPCAHVERFKVPSRDRFLRPDEFTRFAASLAEEGGLMRDFFWMCLLTGARRGNVQTMEWAEIDFDLRTWTIQAEKFKNGYTQVMPLTQPALAILSKRREKCCDDNSWIFPGRATGHLIEPKRAWKRVIERAGIVNLRIHDLRRTLGSYLAIHGENQYVIARMLGHRDMRSTAVYARLDLRAVRQAAESVSERWQQMLAFPIKAQPLRLVQSTNTRRATAQKQPKNADVQLTRVEQQILEGKILTVLRAGGSTKKHFYKKIGSQFPVNSFEMERVLNELAKRELITAFRDDLRHWRYSLKEPTALSGQLAV